jgi:hypothetical protein
MSYLARTIHSELIEPSLMVGLMPRVCVGKWLWVVVKYEEADAFVITAYLTNTPKAGEDLWPTK